MRVLFFLLFPIFLSAQINRAYGVIEIGSTFPSSSATGPKFAYRPADSAFYRWQHTNVWVKVVEPSITPDTLYLQQISGTTAIVNGDTINLTPYVLKTDTTSILAPYIKLAGWGLLKTTNTLTVDSTLLATKTFTNRFLLKSDTAAMLSNYPSTVGYGILKNTKTIRADTTSPNGLATRLFTKTLPTTIANTRVAYSNGSSLVGSSSLIWDNTNGRLSVGGTSTGSDFEINKNTNAPTYASIINGNSGNSVYATLWMRASPNANAIGLIGKMGDNVPSAQIRNPGDFFLFNGSAGGDISIINQNSSGKIKFANTNTSTPQMTLVETGNLLLGTTTDVPTSILTARSTTKSSSPFPLHTLAESNAITGVQGNFDYETTQNGLRWYNGTRKAYALESTFARGTATYIPYFDANGQVAENAFLAMLGATAALQIPVGTTAQRPTVAAGLLRLNSTMQSLEFGNNAAGSGGTWVALARANNATGNFSASFVPYGSGAGSRLNESGNFTYSGGVLQLVSGSLSVNNSPTGTTILTALDLARTAGGADPSVGSGIGIQFRRRESGNTFTANVLSHEIFAFSAGVVTSGYRFTVHNNTSQPNPATTAFLINGHNVSVPDGGFTVSNSTVTPYVNITTTASSGNKEAGLYIKSRGNFGAVIEFDNASTSPGASALGNILNFYNYKTANSGFTVVRMGGGNGNYGMDVVGQFTVRDSVDNLDRFQVNSGGTIIMNAYGTPATTAAALSKTLTNYGVGFATDGTVTSRLVTTYGLYAGSGTLASQITRPLISPNNKLMFTQKYNSNADSTYLIFDNFDNLDGYRSIRWGLTDTVHAGGYSYGRAYKDEGNDYMGYETFTNDSDGETSIRQFGGTLNLASDGSTNISASEIRLTGAEIRANLFGIGDMKSSDLGHNKPTHLAAFSPNGSLGNGWIVDYPLDSIPTNSIYNNLPNGSVSIDADGNNLEFNNISSFFLGGVDGSGQFYFDDYEIALTSEDNVDIESGTNANPYQAKVVLASQNQSLVRLDVENRFGYNQVRLDSTDFTISEAKTGSTRDTLFKVDFEGDESGLLTLSKYASSTFTAPALSVDATESFLGIGTGGKVLQRKIRETTWTNSNLTVTDDMLESAQDIFVYANCPAVATDSTVVDLPAPSVDYIGQVVEVCGDGRNATPNYQVYVRGVGATLWHQAGGADPSAQTYLEVTNLSSNHNTVKFICAQPSGSTYYWILLKQ